MSVGTQATLTSINACQQVDCVFCTQKGAANDAYFREHFRTLNIKSEASIDDQIGQLLSDKPGTCEAIELTREDLHRWAAQPNMERCGIEVAPSPIMERQVTPLGLLQLLGSAAVVCVCVCVSECVRVCVCA